MKYLILLLLPLLFSCEEYPDNNFITEDAHIKNVAFKKKQKNELLTSFEVYNLMEKIIVSQIDSNQYQFKLNKVDLRKCITAMICVESGHLNSSLVLINNLLGIKVLKLRPSLKFPSDEYNKNQKKMISELSNFAAFFSFEDCIHNWFTIMKGKRFLKVRESENISDFLFYIQKCGYATDPAYMSLCYEKIILIKKEQLSKN